MAQEQSRLIGILKNNEHDLLKDWLTELSVSGADNDGMIDGGELRAQAAEFIKHLQVAVQSGNGEDIGRAEWTPVRDFLEEITRSRVGQGFRSDQNAAFIFSFKRPLFSRLGILLKGDAETLAKEVWSATELLDNLAMHTVKAFQKTREDVIRRQQEELLELSTPVVKLWEGVLALPMIGTLDSSRTQIVMESLLQRIVDTGAEIAIIDITGVPTVDTLVAQHLLKTVTAIRLMGADCIISGIRPQIAQTIVHLGVDLDGVSTKANLSDALAMALKRTGFLISKTKI